ncbi:uncharacterized protein LY79DRAFT_207820 [Colletotrichum navitas]|uniref:Uncharacterized protein n=1 Tax=Colletotrichum navitas TaxID=681940 RepID=A0AAD8QAI9_9PEZI|nr:uncharacterized protein LY79DRAFT_207820 [Colletotrichum navitas]KAK1599086.1 hypothetical protein LY79DRAFT_207820 [Colletotrichum navitas]
MRLAQDQQPKVFSLTNINRKRKGKKKKKPPPLALSSFYSQRSALSHPPRRPDLNSHKPTHTHTELLLSQFITVHIHFSSLAHPSHLSPHIALTRLHLQLLLPAPRLIVETFFPASWSSCHRTFSSQFQAFSFEPPASPRYLQSRPPAYTILLPLLLRSFVLGTLAAVFHWRIYHPSNIPSTEGSFIVDRPPAKTSPKQSE